MFKRRQPYTDEEMQEIEDRALRSWSESLSRGEHIEYETHLWASSLGMVEKKQKEIFEYLRKMGKIK